MVDAMLSINHFHLWLPWWPQYAALDVCLVPVSWFHTTAKMALSWYKFLQVVMSFHACGSNVNDTVSIPLPQWVLEVRFKPPFLMLTLQGYLHIPTSLMWWNVNLDNLCALCNGLHSWKGWRQWIPSCTSSSFTSCTVRISILRGYICMGENSSRKGILHLDE